jgi:hypothetical protein
MTEADSRPEQHMEFVRFVHQAEDSERGQRLQARIGGDRYYPSSGLLPSGGDAFHNVLGVCCPDSWMSRTLRDIRHALLYHIRGIDFVGRVSDPSQLPN